MTDSTGTELSPTAPAPADVPWAAPAGRSPRIKTFGQWARGHKLGVAGAAFVILAIVVAAAAPLLAPHDPFDVDLSRRLLSPSWMEGGTSEFPLGTDSLGRDILSRLIYGSRVSLAAGGLAVTVSLAIGVALGLIAGYAGKWIDTAISTFVDIMITFPFILLALVVVAILGPSFRNMIIVLGVTAWTVYTRVLRNQILALREREFVQAARAMGFSHARIIVGQLLPNVMGPILVLGSLQVAQMILAEAFLSFLGVGVQPPTPSWGAMLGEGRTLIASKWWLTAFPGLAIFGTTLGINLLGDALRDTLDPNAL